MGKFFLVTSGENAQKDLLSALNGKRKESILKTYRGFYLTGSD
jgi:hypothetical protein